MLFHPPKKKNVFGRWHVSWKGPFRVMKKLNESNYVVQRSFRSRSFVVHGDRLRPYRAKVEQGSWPAPFMDAAQSTQAADSPHDPDSDGQQQHAVEERRPGRSRGRPQLAENRATRPTGDDRIATTPTSSARQQPPSCTVSVPQTDTLTYSDEPSSRQRTTGGSNRPITDTAPRRSGRKRRPPAKLRHVAGRCHAAPVERSHLTNFVDYSDSTADKLCFDNDVNRLSSTSSSYDSSDDNSDNMDYSQHADVRYSSSTSRIESRSRSQRSRLNPDFIPRRCTICRDRGIETRLFTSRGDITIHTKEEHGCWYSPYGDRYVPIDPEQLAEGRARKIARQVEQKHRQLRR